MYVSGRLDHVALGTPQFDAQLRTLTESLGMTVRRHGTHAASGRRLAMLADSTGLKLELVETTKPGLALLHLAYRVGDVPSETDRLRAAGWTPTREPHNLAAARAVSALLDDPLGTSIQLIAYAPDSPDAA